MNQFKNLEEACGGRLNPETLRKFKLAMAEYEVLMAGLQQMLAPVSPETKWANTVMTELRRRRAAGEE